MNRSLTFVSIEFGSEISCDIVESDSKMVIARIV